MHIAMIGPGRTGGNISCHPMRAAYHYAVCDPNAVARAAPDEEPPLEVLLAFVQDSGEDPETAKDKEPVASAEVSARERNAE